jgi:hypothetical protein
MKYNGKIPHYLEKALEKMNEVDNKPPRNAYRKYRRRNRGKM